VTEQNHTSGDRDNALVVVIAFAVIMITLLIKHFT
jgi:hypothetical protein